MKKITVEIYAITKTFPHDEQGYNGIVNQMRRACISAVSNLAEGSSRESREFARFLTLSLGSLKEVDAQLETAFEIGYVKKEDYEITHERLDECIRKLYRYNQKVSQTAKVSNQYKREIFEKNSK